MSGFMMLLKNVGALADDTSTLIQTTMKNTMAVLGDDLAVSAEKTSSFDPNRELKLVWDIIKGSLLNKIIILPIIFAFSYFYPPLIEICLFLGGLYLSYEGAEAILEFFHKQNNNKENNNIFTETEEEQVKDAIKIDFVLSIEIVIIALASTIGKPFTEQVIATSITAFAATIFVYGVVAIIIRLDDIGLWLYTHNKRRLGRILITSMPVIIKMLKYIGLFAMLKVGGGIIFHTFHLHNYFYIADILSSFLIGIVIVFIVNLVEKIKKEK